MKKVLLSLALSFTLVSCATTKNETTMMHGMFVNSSNVPVPEVEIFDEENLIGRSNANGFFEISVPSDNTIFYAKKSGWETKNIYEPFVDSTKLYIYKIKSLELVYADIEKFILQNDFQSATNLIEDLEEKYGQNQDVLFLKSVVAYKCGDFELANQFFTDAGFEDDKNPYLKKFHEKIGGEMWSEQISENE